MAILHQVSFYNECGHIEDCIRASDLLETLNVAAVEEGVAMLPSLDFARAMLDPGNSVFTTEVYYKTSKCGRCEGALPAGPGRSETVGELTESAIKDRRMLWKSITDNLVAPQAILKERHKALLECIRGTLLSSSDPNAPATFDIWSKNLSRSIERERRWYQDFVLLHFRELQLGFPLLQRTHAYAPGWRSELFAAVDNWTIDKDEVCSICQLPSGVPNVRVSQLPCKHQFHFSCIDQWMGAHGTCPMCRTMFNILYPPRPTNVFPEIRDGLEQLTAEQTHKGYYHLGAALEPVLLTERFLDGWNTFTR
ncbi:uncharacterized protein LY89DRAFT_672285 [Mollisia scopiformis]|uniref:RING-type domain-containing protein n=1 Tax=Mollisia scopiformis TaxID=149040 RepID=A0A194X1E7_MOLSC|nr:uncharacterized protein LY89DRAFT_672285 [Mollisia scopiformis]KUJ14020.1 hypothetical protein LY89DRAFT_672285 [Mollisia scopiformis]